MRSLRLATLALITVTACLTACGERDDDAGGEQGPQRGSATPTGIRYLSAADRADGFERATEPRPFTFPKDHGSHSGFRSEWWYFTGNVFGTDGEHYGFELTFFRYALAAEAPVSAAAWSTNQFWMAHLAITDTSNGTFIAEERLTRGAAGLAGAQVEPFRAWVEDWTVTGAPASRSDAPTFHLDASGERIAIDLTLEARKPAVAHGDQGLDAKGPEPGNASFYYSLTRFGVRGEIEVDGNAASVEGLAWMDREWSTSALGPDLEGWDWFALQLDDGTDLMIYRLRRRDGTASPFSGGSLIDANGERRALDIEQLEMTALDHWTSPDSGARYPIAWRLSLPAESIVLDVRPYLEHQEIDLSVRYWEGAVHVQGRSPSGTVNGNGYMELAGY